MKKHIMQALQSLPAVNLLYSILWNTEPEKALAIMVDFVKSAIRFTAIKNSWDSDLETRVYEEANTIASLAYILYTEKAKKQGGKPEKTQAELTKLRESKRRYYLIDGRPSAALVLYRAAFQAINRHWRENYKHAFAALYQTDENGKEYCIIDTESFNRPQGFTSPESMVYKVALEQERKGGRLTERDEKAAMQIMEYNTRISNTCIGSGAKMVRFTKRMKKVLSNMEG